MENDVWATLNKGIDAVANYKMARVAGDTAVARDRVSLDVFRSGMAAATAASPSGAAQAGWNPFPGMFSAYPQNDGKGGAGASQFSFGVVAVIVGVVMLVLALAFRK